MREVVAKQFIDLDRGFGLGLQLAARLAKHTYLELGNFWVQGSGLNLMIKPKAKDQSFQQQENPYRDCDTRGNNSEIGYILLQLLSKKKARSTRYPGPTKY